MSNFTSDLICQKISSKLVNKIKDDVVLIGNKSHTAHVAYISNDGSDETGDGSTDKPYKTLLHALVIETQKRTCYYQYEFRFLTDYIEKQIITLPRNKTCCIDSNGFNVQFNEIFKGYNSYAILRGLTFNKGCNASENSYFVLDSKPSTFNISDGDYGIISRYNSHVLVSQPLTFNCTNADQVLRTHNNSIIAMNGPSLKIIGSGTTFAYVSSDSCLWYGSMFKFTDDSSVTEFKKYHVQSGSIYLTIGRGNDFYPEGMADGYIDEISIIN